MGSSYVRDATIAAALVLLLSGVAQAQSQPAIDLTLDASEAEQALVVLRKRATLQTVTDADWRRLFDTQPYQWLKAREASMGRSFADDEFKTFLLSPEARSKEEEWTRTLAQMKQAD